MKREKQINELQNQINAKLEIFDSLPLSIDHYPELKAEVDALAEKRDALQTEINAERKAENEEYMRQHGLGDVFSGEWGK